MRDLEISRRLASGAVTPAEVDALGGATLAGRAAMFGHVLALAAADDPAMRAAAMRALTGVRGVPGLRAIVRGLGDPEPAVRDAALAALRATGRDVPQRYAHALFHPDVAVRRAALVDVPAPAHGIAAYLRADPECRALAEHVPWPRGDFALAFDLHAMERLAHTELLNLLTHSTPDELRRFLLGERGRDKSTVADYIEDAARSAMPRPLRGSDPIDRWVIALAESDAAGYMLDHFFATVVHKHRLLAQRAFVAVWSQVLAKRSPLLAGIAVALDPLLLEYASFDPAFARVACASLIARGWPVRPTPKAIERLLALPIVRGDLANAAAVVGLLPAKRYAALADAFGEQALLDALVAGNHGWAEICKLPQESPAREIGWLRRLDGHRERYRTLTAIALGVFEGKRLEAFIEALPRWDRPLSFVEFAAGCRDAERLASVCTAIASRLDHAALSQIFEALLAGAGGAPTALVLARVLPEKQLAAAVRTLDDNAAEHLVAVLAGPDPLPRDRELAIAGVFAERTRPAVRAWAEKIRDFVNAPPITLLPTAAPRALSVAERANISSAPASDLQLALGPALLAPVTGLVDALAGRAASPNLYACAALLACGDPIMDVARELDRFVDPTPGFDDELDTVVARIWNYRGDLPPLANARLFRWERHTDALARWLDVAGGPHAALGLASRLPGRLAARTLWRGIAEVIVFARYRDPNWLVKHGTVALAVFAAERLDRDVGRFAARMVITLVETGRVPLAAVKAIVLERAADAEAETRAFLVRIARLEGMPEPPPVLDDGTPDAELVAEIRRTTDLDRLVGWCRDTRLALVHEAVMALVLLGPAGQARLAALLDEVTRLPVPVPLLASTVFWESPAREIAQRFAEADLPPEWQFHLSLGLGDHARALAAVRAPSHGWFRREHWQQLVAAIDIFECALAVADAPHHHAYQPAVQVLCDHDDPRAADALRRFLEVDGDRPLHLRRTVARRLLDQYRDATGMPILIEEIVDEGTGEYGHLLAKLPPRAAAQIAETIVAAALIGGHSACSEKRALVVIKHLAEFRLLDRETLARLYTRILEEATTSAARRSAAQHAVTFATGEQRLLRVAEVFAWGVRRGAELTGRLYRFHMTSEEREFGHTRLDGSAIFVSALPMLRDEAHGRDIVEGLVLHEIGHHAYHRSDAARAVWKQAHAEGLGNLLNLIADEHLERNLRGVDHAYGDRLKRLGAYAFQHAPQEISLSKLLAALRGHAARALSNAELDVAFDDRSVRLRRGAILTELERAGHPLARFSRALRMGLGNRTGDPLVAQALALCTGNLRKLDMQGLYDLTKRLADLFGGALSIAELFGGPEGLEFGERDADVFGAGVDDDILQREVERILDPRRRDKAPRRDGTLERLQINVAPDDEFDRITHVERVRGDGAAHRQVAVEVTRHATRLRAYLDDLGLRYEPARARIAGRTVDRTRLRALVTRNDPRLLIARQPIRRTDLFLGTVIDCSGSMQAGDNIARARRFGILIAEAVKPLVGVEARFFGFTDSVIYDAGNAGDCGVTALAPGGGNNDAAALYHAATVALASRKRAKVLVMISDGLPTECSVGALRALVTQLTRRKGIVCAQVAVRALEEECFPHYVVLDDEQIDIAVARFGRMIGDLARRVLAA